MSSIIQKCIRIFKRERSLNQKKKKTSLKEKIKIKPNLVRMLLIKLKKMKSKEKSLKLLDLGKKPLIIHLFFSRNYLMEFIVPSLSEALIEVTDTRPDDPIDFLVFIVLILLFLG